MLLGGAGAFHAAGHPGFLLSPPDNPEEQGHTAGRIALLIENDAELRRAIVLLLERRGVSVLEAGSGEEALELLEEIDIVPDLYIVDQQLGDAMTGIETVEALHAKYGERPTRIDPTLLVAIVAQCGDGTLPECPLIETLFGTPGDASGISKSGRPNPPHRSAKPRAAG